MLEMLWCDNNEVPRLKGPDIGEPWFDEWIYPEVAERIGIDEDRLAKREWADRKHGHYRSDGAGFRASD